ncbi:MAG: S41 family peptidase [Sphingobacteriales bacterium]|nr:MAG: S41 family peptidase [Sphingobacteriales bacterium]TAF80924.1 MAG: S41 family peptidase [Sphingobacteriales bacterium]
MHPVPKRKKIIFLSFFTLISFVFFSFRDDLFQISKNLDIFASIYKELNMSYVDDVNSSTIIKTSIDAMLQNLDPYTEYVPESDVEDYKMKYVSTQYGGIGAGVFYRNNKVYISDVFEGFPAQKANIKPGDELVSIDGVALQGKKSEQVSLLLKGPRETAVKIMISREGKIIEKNIFRAEINQPNVSYFGMLENNVGYIKLDKFLENSAQEVKNALIEIKKNNPKGLILDLRYNGGGILQEAVKIVNFFIAKDVEIVVQKGRNTEKNIHYKTYTQALDAQIPLIILVNNRSASASEIVAGSLQDLDRAVIIGQQSFGKGLVQQTFNLPYNSLVKITVAKYYTPSGRCIQALDYAHRSKEGAVNKFSDSLKTEFKTKNGRSVYDGSGIYPDIYIPRYTYHQITQSLLSKYLLFDYASNYVQKKPQIVAAKNFYLNDAEYANFVTFINNKDYSYTTETETMLQSMVKQAEKEKIYTELKTELDALKTKVYSAKKDDLNQYKPEIKRILESEIVQRYYYDKGKYEHAFQYDTELKEALKLVTNKISYDAILKGDKQYKVIGKPGKMLVQED